MPTSISPASGILPPPVPTGGVSLLVHGGAWDIPDDVLDAHRADLAAALALGQTMLLEGQSAVETVAAVVALMEKSGTFDAGCGSVLTAEGCVEMDAGVMCGHRLRYGSVIGIQRYPQPIKIAARLLEAGQGEVRMLAGMGAEAFAAREGFSSVPPHALVHPREQARHDARVRASLASLPAAPQGTVGCVARDRQGHLAAATSTGGTPFKPPGRVGDSPLPGAGFYACADGAVSFTGWGEAISTRVAGMESLYRLRNAPAQHALVDTLAEMQRGILHADGKGAEAGAILLDASGAGAWAFTTPRMARAGWAEGCPAFVLV